MVALAAAWDTNFDYVVAEGFLSAVRGWALVFAVSMLVPTEPALSWFGVCHAHVGWVVELKVVAAVGVFVVWLDTLDPAPLVV